jgi:hypothetical protein
MLDLKLMIISKIFFKVLIKYVHHDLNKFLFIFFKDLLGIIKETILPIL